MGLQGAAALSRNAEQAQRIEGAVAEIDRAIRDLRSYIFGLRPGILADRHLDQAIRELAKEFEERTGVVTVVDLEEDVAGALAPLAQDVVQMAREALSNVGRHAKAATCRVSLRRRDGRALLEVDDDGEGFDPAKITPGQGLANLRDRAAGIGGSAEIDSSPAGTVVRISLPL
jgi:signal transduction histidine kinase